MYANAAAIALKAVNFDSILSFSLSHSVVAVIDQPETKKKGIFDRLEMERSSPDQTIQMTTVGLVGKPISSSIFSRLGGKSEIEEEIDVAYAGIFKSASKKVSNANACYNMLNKLMCCHCFHCSWTASRNHPSNRK